MVGAIGGGILFGALSGPIGRRRAMVIALLGALAVVPLWAFAPHPAALVAGAFLLQLMVQGAWGVIPAHITELSPDQVRGFLPGFAYQCGVLAASSVAYVEALLAERTSYASAMASVAVVVLSVAAVVVALGPERSGVVFGSAPHQRTATSTPPSRLNQHDIPSSNMAWDEGWRWWSRPSSGAR